MVLRPNDAIGTREGPGDIIASVEASFFLLIFSNTRTFLNTRTLDHNTRTLGNYVTSCASTATPPRSKLASGRP